MIPLLEIDFPNISPTIMPIWGDLAVRWYGLGYLAAFLFTYYVLRKLQRGGYLQVGFDDCMSMLMYAIVGTFIGGRLGYLILYDDYFTTGKLFSNPGDLIGLGKGGVSGLSFHGGLMGVVLAGWLFSWTRARRQHNALPEDERKKQGRKGFWQRFRAIWAGGFDACILGVPFGIFCVRLFGNFINGELYGRIITDAAGNPITDAANAPAWAMRFPTAPEGQQALAQALHPHQPYSNIIPLPVDWDVWSDVSQQVPLRHPSQIYQALGEGLAVLLLVWLLRKRLAKRGMLAGVFMLAYAATRWPMELYRQPDSQFSKGRTMSGWGEALDSMGMTQGQFLSTLMGLAGIAMIVICARSKNPFLVRSADQLKLMAPAMTPEAAGTPVPKDKSKQPPS